MEENGLLCGQGPMPFLDEPCLFIKDLGLWGQKSSRGPPSQEAFDQNGQIVYEPFDDGWPGYEEPSIMLNLC